MKQLAILALIALLAISVLACGGESTEPADTSTPASGGSEATEPTAGPTNTPQPESSPVPTDTPGPAAPQPTDTPVPQPTNTTVPEPTATQAPNPTLPPEPTITSQTEATPVPTFTPEPTPTPTPAPALPIAADLSPLGDNLLFVAYFDGATQGWSIYDASGTFSPDQLPLPPGGSAPDAADIGSITELVVGQIYNFVMREGQTAVLNERSITFYPKVNQLQWK